MINPTEMILWEMVLLILLVSFCLIFRKNQLGLLGTYIFVFYSGMMVYKSTFINSSGLSTWSMYLYIICGLGVVGLVIFGFDKQERITGRQKTMK